jgi:membrane protein
MIKMREKNAREVIKGEFQCMVKTVRDAHSIHAKDLAATIAFWTFFSIFPLLIGVISLAGYFLDSMQMQDRIGEAIATMFPGSATLVRENIEAVIRHRGTMSWVGVIALLWTAGKGFGAVTRAVNSAIGAKRRHLLILSKLRYFLMAAAVSVLTIASIGITAVIEIALDPQVLSRFGVDAVEVSRLKGWSLSIIMVFLMFSLIYKITPYVEVAWRQVIPGSLLAALLFVLCKALFLFYLDQIADFVAIYGSLSSIIVLLLWLYVSSLILVLGAVYNIVRSLANDTSTGSASGEKK